ncbi:MAG TPA: carbohydrate ABC transporter permease [Thermomicrobiales bacterium]
MGIFRSHRRTEQLMDALTYFVLGAIVLFAILPLVWVFITSFKPESDIVTATLQYLPQHITFDNYLTLWRRSSFPTLIKNSAIVATMTVVICILLGTLAAYAISHYRFRGRDRLMLFFLVSRMFPVVLLLIPLFVMMKNLGLLDSHLGLALAYSSFLLPLCIWMLKGFFDAIPNDLEEAARIDGCTRIGALFRIVLPLARPGLVATAVFVAIGAWNEFLLALMLTTSQGSRTWPVGLQLMVGEFQLPWGQLSAGGMISILPVILFFGLVQRALVRGLTSGAVKG